MDCGQSNARKSQSPPPPLKKMLVESDVSSHRFDKTVRSNLQYMMSFVHTILISQWREWLKLLFAAAFLTQTVQAQGQSLKFDIWDTAGQERYHSLAPMYYRGAQAAVVVYDINNAVSYVCDVADFFIFIYKLYCKSCICLWCCYCECGI